ncbi:MAG: tetratricopeptide repeat protein [bacterium]|nr:tetratricopeptide repeat protein [bacterium]MDT8366962.1 tetratricopeptide repeat protein [bacterium]
MSYIKKRVPRKPGMTPQEILADQKTLASWFTDNANLIAYASVAIFLVIAVTFGIIWMKGQKKDTANAALSKAMALYQVTVAQMETSTKDLELALESLNEVASEYADASQGYTASLLKANVLYRLERYQEGAATIEALDISNHELVNDINGFYLLARSYEAMEEFKMAIESYQKAKGRARGDMIAVIDIDLARCNELAGNVDTAISIYKEVLSEYPDTVYATRAEKKLATLGITDLETL